MSIIYHFHSNFVLCSFIVLPPWLKGLITVSFMVIISYYILMCVLHTCKYHLCGELWIKFQENRQNLCFQLNCNRSFELFLFAFFKQICSNVQCLCWEMTQKLKDTCALAENLGPFLSTYMVAHNHLQLWL